MVTVVAVMPAFVVMFPMSSPIPVFRENNATGD